MANNSSVELDHCRELALLPGSLFEFTSRFLQASQLEPLLALYALKQAVCSIPHSPVDDAVKWAKLKWWSEELVADPVLPSRHPVLRVLWQSGARNKLKNTLLLGLVNDAVVQIDAAPANDENAMFDRCSASGMTEIQLELTLDNAEIDTQNLRCLAAASSLFRMISSFAPNQHPETERLPLNILAKYNISSTQLQNHLYPNELSQIITQLADIALDWFSKGMKGLKLSQANVADTRVSAHLQLRWQMEKRRLDVVRKDAMGFIVADKRYGPTDAWFAWRFLRHLK